VRIAEAFLQSQWDQVLAARQTALANQQMRIALGRQHLRRSDDPSSASTAAVLRQQQDFNEQWKFNANHAIDWTRATEGRVTEVVEIMQRTHELAVQAGDGTLNDNDRNRIAQEIDGMLETLFMIGNIRHRDIYIFAGTHSDQPPLTVNRDPSGSITSVTTAPVPASLREVQVGESAIVQYGLLADGEGGLFRDSISGSDVFQTMIDLRDTLGAGAPPGDALLADVNVAMNHSIGRLVETGVLQQRFETLGTHFDTVGVQLSNRLGEIDDLDLSKALNELSQLEFSLQASMQMASRLHALHLTNFL
jgi:flagellar hook-associated protein 3 FlgL